MTAHFFNHHIDVVFFESFEAGEAVGVFELFID